ncbi:MAG TPA: helicase-related protein [Polyangiaceae bacterium]|nr:helicase-related protein [Polyangiaceae bacterium]
MASSGTAAVASVTALLGPTNTGKTHRAIERMLEHPSGMIGLPLRLLAREVYDRVTARLGEREVALVTGEEKRIPERARYWICTVEAMPVEREVAFLAVDEVQLAAHRERGHVFTERLLRARGTLETWFLGSHSMGDVLREVVPTARIQSHPRFSRLRSSGETTLAALPARSAVVAFSAARVYELAERIRRKHGGAAVVLGALSPRARNAQVSLYQAGEVNHLVATDAIGMGLNLDILHVAFADVRKFDGREARPLEAAELAQIAGRAGRYLNDGSFGTLAPVARLPVPIERAIENHHFPAQRTLWWRNADLDFSSIEALMASLCVRSPSLRLRVSEGAEDFAALRELAKKDEIRSRVQGREHVQLLWEVCRIPDYRGLLLDYHASMLGELFLQLSGKAGRIPSDWAAPRIRKLNDTEGDVDSLLARLAFIRTWTYISNQPDWIEDRAAWCEQTRSIEDRLSDALHERLVARFVDRVATAKTLRARARSRASPAEDESATDLEHPFAQLLSLRDELLRKHPATAPAAGAADWLEALIAAPHESFTLDEKARIHADGEVLARLTRGTDLLRPEVTLLLDDLGAGARSRVQRRLLAYARDVVSELCAALRAQALSELSPAGRGLVYQLEHGMGTLRAVQAAEQLAALTAADRAALDEGGVCLARRVVYVPAMLETQRIRWRLALWLAHTGQLLALPNGAPSLAVPARSSNEAYAAMGYPVFGPLALRADVVERVEALLERCARRGPFRPPAVLANKLDCAREHLPALVRAFDYRALGGGRYAREGRGSAGVGQKTR